MVAPITNGTAPAHHAHRAGHDHLAGVARVIASRQAGQTADNPRPERSAAKPTGDGHAARAHRAVAFNARQSIDAIGAALNSGDPEALKTAVEAFRSGKKPATQASDSPAATGGATDAATASTGRGRGQRLAALGQALDLGDLEAAKKAFGDLVAQRSEGRHHPHHEQATEVAAATPAISTTKVTQTVQAATADTSPMPLKELDKTASSPTDVQSAAKPAAVAEAKHSHPMAALGEALASGDLDTAKKAFANLAAQRAERHHHHHHGEHGARPASQTTANLPASSTVASAPSSTGATPASEAAAGTAGQSPSRAQFGKQMKVISDALEAGDLEAASKAFAELVAQRLGKAPDAAPAAPAVNPSDASNPVTEPSGVEAATSDAGPVVPAAATIAPSVSASGEIASPELAAANTVTVPAKPDSPMDALSSALSAGDLDAAKKAFADLTAQRGEGRRHHHGHHDQVHGRGHGHHDQVHGRGHGHHDQVHGRGHGHHDHNGSIAPVVAQSVPVPAAVATASDTSAPAA